MRFVIMVKGSTATEAGDLPGEQLLDEMGRFHDDLAKAGVLLDAAGLQPSSKGWRVRYAGSERTVVDGPFAETKELVAGYTVIEVRSREEAMERALRFPNPMGPGADAEIEVRQLFEPGDIEPSAVVDRGGAVISELAGS